MLINNILIIIQRSNGDVFLSASLISQLKENFHPCKIDLLVNDDTLPIAETLHHINKIFTFSYKKKKEERFKHHQYHKTYTTVSRCMTKNAIKCSLACRKDQILRKDFECIRDATAFRRNGEQVSNISCHSDVCFAYFSL